jgi:tRNA-splicing ligase RtcB (3'-phosphate/5'-hydroxy nucleic acid ligase)
MQVMDIKLTNGKPVFSWCPEIESGAIEQVRKIASLPFIEHYSLMPDCHTGMSTPIGSVVATKDVIIPDFVGVDISCGMSCLKTNLSVNDFTTDKKETLHHAVERSIPTGFSHNNDERRKDIEIRFGQKIDFILEKFGTESKMIERKEIASQLGTLGGG